MPSSLQRAVYLEEWLLRARAPWLQAPDCVSPPPASPGSCCAETRRHRGRSLCRVARTEIRAANRGRVEVAIEQVDRAFAARWEDSFAPSAPAPIISILAPRRCRLCGRAEKRRTGRLRARPPG